MIDKLSPANDIDIAAFKKQIYSLSSNPADLLTKFKDNYLQSALDDLLRKAAKVNIKEVKALIAAGADVNARDNNGYTALYWAAYYGNKEIVEVIN